MKNSRIVIGIVASLVGVVFLFWFAYNWFSGGKTAPTPAPIAATPVALTPIPAIKESLIVSQDGKTWRGVTGTQNLNIEFLNLTQNGAGYMGTRGNGLWRANPGLGAFTQIHDSSNIVPDRARMLAISTDRKSVV